MTASANPDEQAVTVVVVPLLEVGQRLALELADRHGVQLGFVDGRPVVSREVADRLVASALGEAAA